MARAVPISDDERAHVRLSDKDEPVKAAHPKPAPAPAGSSKPQQVFNDWAAF